MTEINPDDWDGSHIPQTIGDLANTTPAPHIPEILERDEEYLDEETGKKYRVHVKGIESICKGPGDCGWGKHIIFGPPVSKSYCLFCEQIKQPAPKTPSKPAKPFPQPEIKPEPDDKVKRNSNHHSKHFLMLGHDQGLYYYLPAGSRQVVALAVKQHVEAEFIGLVPDDNFWRTEYGTEDGISWKFARTSLISRQHAVGIYNPDRVRGRGAWWDNSGVAIHLGDRTISDAKQTDHIYEAAVPLHINHENPLTAAEARKFSDICELVSWSKPINARYLAGWCAIAPICGALEWRPHIWVTGPAGSGKSWVMDKILRRIIGDIGLSVQSATTEAGLRQTLRHDARPIMFDEIEGSDQRAQQRIQNVLELARQASTETGARIVKGTTSGDAMTFSIRSAFAFSSIGVSATSRPDETRITVLDLINDGNRDRFEKLSGLVADIMADDYVARFGARSIKMIPIIRQNARVFSAAAAVALGSQRAGDQVGALLAGAWSLHSDDVITAEAAAAWIAKQDWSDHQKQNEDTDESKCLAFLLQAIIRVPTKQGPREMSVAETMGISSERVAATPDEQRAAVQALGLNGFRGDVDGMVISVSHSAIASFLRDTEWARTWGRTLARLPGAQPTRGSVWFGATKTRGIEIPYPADPDKDAELI